MHKTYWSKGERLFTNATGNIRITDIMQGGRSTVYIVDYGFFEKKLAMKVPHEELMLDKGALGDFIKECKIWVNMGIHPNIVRAVSIDLIEEHLCLFIDFIEGETLLKKILNQKKIKIDSGIELSIQFCTGMEYANKKFNLIHGDIKPDNVLISQEGILKITDFGFSKILNPDAPPNNADKIEGTLAYLAPEQINRKISSDIRSDIYSFGVMFYEMLTGDSPFSPKGECCYDLIYNLREPDDKRDEKNIKMWKMNRQNNKIVVPLYKKLKQMNNEIKEKTMSAIAAIVMKCLNINPDKRYKNFGEIRKELMQIAQYDSTIQLERLPSAKAYSSYEKFDEFMKQGLSFFVLEDYQSAISCFEKMAKLEPLKGVIFYNLALCNEKIGDFKKAIVIIEKAISIEPHNALNWFEKMVILKKMGKDELANEYLEKSLKKDPLFSLAWIEKGYQFYMKDDFKEALKCFDKAYVINPKDKYMHRGRAMSLESLGRTFEAEGHFFRAKSGVEKDQAIKTKQSPIEDVLKQNINENIYGSNSASDVERNELNSRLHNMRQRRGIRPAPCGSIFGNINRHDIKQGIKNIESAVELFNKGLKQMSEKQYARAVHVFNSALSTVNSLDKDIPPFIISETKKVEFQKTILSQKSFCLVKNCQFQEAAKCCDDILINNPKDLDVLKKQFFCYMKSKDYNNAIKCIDKIIIEDPYHPGHLVTKASIFSACNKAQESNIICNEAVKIWMKQIKYLSHVGRDRECVSQCTEMLDYFPNFQETLTFRDGALVDMGNYEEAIICAKKCIELNNSNFWAWVNMGLAYFGLTDYVQAEECFEKTIKLDPGMDLALAGLELCYMINNETKCN